MLVFFALATCALLTAVLALALVREVRLRDRYLSLGPDVELAGPLNGSLRFQRTNRGVLVRGEIEALRSELAQLRSESRVANG